MQHKFENAANPVLHDTGFDADDLDAKGKFAY